MAKVKIKHNLQKRNTGFNGWLVSDNAFDSLCCTGYTSLDKCSEVLTCVRKIAEIIGTMTIHIYENTPQGDKRIENELSRKIDIQPCSYLTRKTWMEYIVANMLLFGEGNSVVLVNTMNGLIDNLDPMPATSVSLVQDGLSYKVLINGITFDPDEVLHFPYNPNRFYPWKGDGIRLQAKDIVELVQQGRYTEKKYMERPQPSIIMKVDSMIDEFSSAAKREEFAERYVDTKVTGRPWIIPAEQFEVEQIKPMSLSDLAIADNMKINKESIAAIFGVPAFILGVGSYNKEAWNAFVNNTIKPICTTIQQELTKKLIISEKWYIKFNIMSLLDWDLGTIENVFGKLSDRGFITGNEIRDKIGMSPLDGLDELRVLENYIPYDMADQQKKLVQGGDNNG